VTFEELLKALATRGAAALVDVLSDLPTHRADALSQVLFTSISFLSSCGYLIICCLI
jgi:hypothetical protein